MEDVSACDDGTPGKSPNVTPSSGGLIELPQLAASVRYVVFVD
jgi:hypothetical protein